MMENKFFSDFHSHCQLKQQIVVSYDKGNPRQRHIAKNPKRSEIYQYHVDGEVITNSTHSILSTPAVLKAKRKYGDALIIKGGQMIEYVSSHDV